MAFGKLPRHKVETVTFGIIGYTDGTAVPDPAPHIATFFCQTVDAALFLANVMAYHAPGCVAAQVYDDGKLVQSFTSSDEKKKPGIDSPGSIIVAGGKNPTRE